jgi:hypothetical protein
MNKQDKNKKYKTIIFYTFLIVLIAWYLGEFLENMESVRYVNEQIIQYGSLVELGDRVSFLEKLVAVTIVGYENVIKVTFIFLTLIFTIFTLRGITKE